MKFTRHDNVNMAVTKIVDGHPWIDGQLRASGVLAYQTTLVSPWQPGPIVRLALDTLLEPLPEQPEIVVVGCGQQQQFVSGALLQTAAAAGLGIECMTNDAACRTFNVLLAEGRSVALAIPG